MTDLTKHSTPVSQISSWISERFSPARNWDYPRHLHNREPGHQFVLVTGATNGIGAETLRYLVKHGHTVITHYRNEAGRAELDKISKEALKSYSQRLHYPPIISTRVDLTDTSPSPELNSKLVEFAEWVRIRVPKLDAIILNAGESLLRERSWLARHVRANQWTASNEVMLELFVDLLHDFDSPNHLQGRVVFISSSLAEQALPGLEDYRRVKSHGERMLRSFFSGGPPIFDQSVKDILAFALRPGSVDTRLHREDCLTHGSEVVKKRTADLIANGRLRAPMKIGEIVASMALSGCAFNVRTEDFSVPIERTATITIGDRDYRAYVEAGLSQLE